MASRHQHYGHLTARFEEALAYATRLHNDQSRKGTGIPYVAHLLAVTALVLEWGGDEDMAIAALLHDAVEDQGGMDTLADIRRRFGERVATIVDGCTDSYTHPKPPWKQRKEAYIKRLRVEPGDVRLVSIADKIHNARSILFDLRKDGVSALDRFKGGRDGTLWYYQALVAVFNEIENTPQAAELARLVAEMEQLVERGN
jgi:(p)ppGpp synthase/HD superfamily hydrolase